TGVDQIRREAASDTSSCSGHLVILMRRRSSVTSVSGKLTWNERIAVLSGMACSWGAWVEGDGAGVARASVHKRCFWILPTEVRGKTSRNSTTSGTLKADSFSRHQAMSSLAVAAEPFFRMT